jgi:hypothetical protein
MSRQVSVGNCPVCGAFPTQFVDGGKNGTSYCRFIGDDKRPTNRKPNARKSVRSVRKAAK